MRESGLYWIKSFRGHWGIGFNDLGKWLIIGSDETYEDEDFDVIGDKIEEPKEDEQSKKITLPSSEFFYNRAMARSEEIKNGREKI